MQKDLNFVKNLELDEIPVNFGSFKSNKEFDSLYSKMEIVGLQQQRVGAPVA